MKTLLILLTLASVCYGRIGETLEQCKKRYGDGKQSGDYITFGKQGFWTKAYFASESLVGECIKIVLCGGDITKEILRQFVNENSRGKKWIGLEELDGKGELPEALFCDTEDGELTAMFFKNFKAIYIEIRPKAELPAWQKEHLEREKAKRAETEFEMQSLELEGF